MGIPPYLSLKFIVAFQTASPAALAFEPVLHGTPVPRVGIHLETCPRAVAFYTYIPLTVAGLAGAQVSPSLDGMIARPSVAGKKTARMAGPALGLREAGVIRPDAG